MDSSTLGKTDFGGIARMSEFHKKELSEETGCTNPNGGFQMSEKEVSRETSEKRNGQKP